MKILDKTTQTYKELVLKPGGDTLPIGGIIAFASDTIPSGWLLCDGRAVSRTEYAELFKVIGTKHGSGNGSTTFNLPNPKGRTLVGKDSTDTDFNELGKTGGEKTHTLTVDEMPSHKHELIVNKQQGGANAALQPTWGTAFSSTDSGSILATGGDQPHNNLQPHIVTNFIIKAKNTVVVKGDVIQENGTASENNTYSAKAIDNKLKTNVITGQEVATNEYEDGKQVFAKKINIGSLPNATRKTVQTGLSNVKVIKLHGIARDSSIQIPLPFVYTELPSCIGIMFVNGSLYINTGSDRTGLTGEITIYYTKNA